MSSQSAQSEHKAAEHNTAEHKTNPHYKNFHYANPSSFARPTVGVALFIAFTFISVPPILLFGTWLSRQQTKEATARFDREALLRAQSIEESVREFIRLKQEVLDVTAGTLSAMPDWDISELQVLTDAQIKSSGSFDSFYVGDPQGTSLVFAPSVRPDGSITKAGVNYKDRDYFQKLSKSKKVAIGTLKLGRQSKVANVHIAVPIYEDLDRKEKSEIRGYITAGIKATLIEKIIQRLLQEKDQLHALMVEENHRVIADSSQQTPIFTLLPKSSLFGKNCQNQQGQKTFNLQQQEVRVICKEITIKTLRWTLWMSMPTALINEQASSSTSFTIKVSLFLLFGVLMIAALMSSWVARLMRLITENAQRVSSGYFDITLPQVHWFTPKEVVEVGNISLQTLAKVKASDRKVRDLVQSLEEVNRQQAPLAEAWRQVSDAIEILDAKGKILFVNPAFYELLDLNEPKSDTSQELFGKPSQLFQLTDPISDERSVGEVILSHGQAGLSWSSEVECQLASKRRVHTIHSSPIFDQRDRLVRIVVIRRDVTEERVAQASAAHNDRLAAIGTLAAGMAHEINNPMTYIKMSLDLIQESLSESEQQADKQYLITSDIYDELEDAVSDASEGVERVTGIVGSLLSIARGGGQRGETERMTRVNLNEVAQACANLVKPEFSKKVELHIELDDKLRVWGRRSELIQVILNLLINAAQAMPVDRKSGNWVKVRSKILPSGGVELSVSDNAKGIPEADLPHIFEPFFSSKPVGKGTGLGLAVSKGIIENHHANMAVSSEEGVGTQFMISFPALSSFPDSTDTMVGTPEPLLVEHTPPSQHSINLTSGASLQQTVDSQRKRILIVDDDLLVAKSLAKMLSKETVMIASSGSQALKVLTSYKFDLILSDVMMPEMDGPSFHTEVMKSFPEYQGQFIFITGAAKGGEVAMALKQTQCLVLNKPITKRRLISVVDQFTRHLDSEA